MGVWIKKYQLELIYSAVFIVLASILNTQFLEASNINTTIAGHDEYIAVKEVYSILHPVSFKHFVMAVISGNALYYGRIMFYADALVAYLPFKWAGITGMVLAIRLFHSLLMLGAILLLSRTFLEEKWQKGLFYLGSTCLYYSLYFIMMPKPEPMQLFVLALFFNRFKKSGWQFGKHFIYLGIAYGLKFNVLLILPILFIWPFVQQKTSQFLRYWKDVFKAVLYFIGGILIAVPCLIASPVKPIFLKTYLHETFGGTVKGYDQADLSFMDWMFSGLGGSYLGHWILAVPFLILVLIALIQGFKRYFSGRNEDFAAFLFLTSGLIMALVIMFNTKRLWPHYLWTSYILLLLGLLLWIRSLQGIPFKVYLLGLLLFLTSSFTFFVIRELPLYLSLSESDEIKNNRKWSHQMYNYINTNYPNSKVGIDGSFLYPFAEFVKTDIYHPFAQPLKAEKGGTYTWYTDKPEAIWTESNQLVAFFKRHPARMLKESPNVYVGRHEDLYKLYREKTYSSFIRDTAFGEIILYKRK